MRSPAKPQVVFAVESHMDRIAREMGLDPYQFRMMNVLQEGDQAPTGGVWQEIRAEETLRQAAGKAGWDKPKTGPQQGRGMAISDMAPGTGKSTATVAMDQVEGGFEIKSVHLDVTAKIPGADEAKFKEAAENAKAGCPISKLYKGAEITLDAKLA